MSRVPLKEIKGVIPALVSCFDEHENYDEKRQRKVTSYLIDRGIHGLYLTGSTGEGFLMTPEERKKLVEDVIDEVKGRVPVIVHVGAIGTRISADLAKHAEAAGADAISSVPPFYWKFSESQMYSYYRDISESVNIPMVVYNIALAGAVGFNFIKSLASIKGVEGIKYTLTSQFEMMRIKEEIGQDFMVYSGADEMAMTGLSFGADGIIGSFYNLIPEPFLDIYKAVQEGNLFAAAEKQRIANAIIMHTLDRGFQVGIKAEMQWMGLDAGYCREPFGRLEPAMEAKYKEDFRELKKQLAVTGIPFLDKL
ncbi:dihydrodipicolinate synthase family protein [Breznakiella homolactica]|uniref:Dihydrodipicolinate synthase family protein n=1 Tax=Breznakiella homolactica TaxID=2798577 RepID=A0A7T7XNF2_9SPIR|nr:dihydrodipicolinate synthase family protein [Breznakiella homolactica]QQO09536.1 dihydrodipicolinate synthase family protein [Breznakiella homolactica]